jgi:hypothetical protein
MIDLLLNSSNIGNPFRINMPFLLDTAIKYNHKNVIKYFLVNHFEQINKNKDFQLKSHKIIHRIKDCEDLFFYCIQTKKIIVTNSILSGIITMNYFSLLVYCLQKRRIAKNGHSQFINQCIQEENIQCLDYLLQLSDIENRTFTEYFHAKRKFSPKFLHHIINNYLQKLSKSINIIQLCIQKGIDNKIIYHLIDLKFKYGYEEIQWVVGERKLDLLKYLVNHME